NMNIKFFKYNFKPRGVMIWINSNISFDIFERHPFPRSYFIWIWHWLLVILPNHYMVIFMLGKSIVKWSMINKRQYFFKLCGKAHFLLQPPFPRRNITFPITLMTTTGIGPQSRRVVLMGSPLL